MSVYLLTFRYEYALVCLLLHVKLKKNCGNTSKPRNIRIIPSYTPFDPAAAIHKYVLSSLGLLFLKVFLLWTPAQRKRASMLYFANVFFEFFFMAALFSGPG